MHLSSWFRFIVEVEAGSGILSKFRSYHWENAAVTHPACIDKLTKIGLSVKVLIYNQGSNNHQFIESLEKVTSDKPIIAVDHKNISVIYDPPTC